MDELQNNDAFGRPGTEPRWTQGSKDGVGTAYAASCHVWFTLWNGVLTEVYYPTIDRPQIRDLQLLLTDGESFFHEEKRHLKSRAERLCPSLAYRLVNDDPNGRYQVTKEVITDPHLPCVLQRVSITGEPELLRRLRVYALCAPHLEVGGWDNNARVMEVAGRRVLVAHKRTSERETWLAMAATVPFGQTSCGYVGRSDGWTDLSADLEMDWEFARAEQGNVALTGELLLGDGAREFTLGIAFGDGEHAAVTTLFQSLGIPFEKQRAKYLDQWQRPAKRRLPLEGPAGDGGNLYRASYSLLLAHEDKRYPGALIASLSIPWGEVKGDEDMGGYHLVWTRDMTNSALALLAAGNSETPLRALIYLAASQEPDGSFAQNFWINGQPYWRAKQLDQVAYPILLAHRLQAEKALRDFDPYPTVLRAASFLVQQGPVTEQERWEEAAGLSPSTLAVSIAALVCASIFARAHGDEDTAQFLEEYADWIECHVEDWTVTEKGTLLPEVKRHFVRINPVRPGAPIPRRLPQDAMLTIANRAPGAQSSFPASEIIDAGFLELVRYGVRAADDLTVVDSLRVVDQVLKVETPFGFCFRRYNHDGYGQRDDGTPYNHWGRGRGWPLLCGERGHYELAAGRDVTSFVHSMEGFAVPTGLLPEQVWDAPDQPAAHMHLGRPTGAAMPLAWAHGEYIKLLRSIRDGQIFDRVPEVADRYLGDRHQCKRIQMWSFAYRAQNVRPGETLRVLATAPFRLRWSADEWQSQTDVESAPTALGVQFADIQMSDAPAAPVRFTFFWPEADRWEGEDFEVPIGD